MLFVLGLAATARAALTNTLRSKKPRRPSRMSRRLTCDELGPLIEPCQSFIREPSTFKNTVTAIAVETAQEAAAPLLHALSACPLEFGDVGIALLAGKIADTIHPENVEF